MPKHTYPTPTTRTDAGELARSPHLLARPAAVALYGAAMAQQAAIDEANSDRPNFGIAATHAEGCRRILEGLRYLSAVDPDPGELGAIAAGFGFGWDIDEESFTSPLLNGIY